MNNRIKIVPSDFDFEYTGSNLTEKTAIAGGNIQLSGSELLSKIKNKVIFGDYIMRYKFITQINENGTAEGINDVGSVDSGNWSIDIENHTMTTKWNNGWFDTVTRAYTVNGNIEFFDIDTGNWRTTFKIFKNREEK